MLGIESSCDDTAAAVCIDGSIVSNVISNQDVHSRYGGVVPELASRAHLSNFIPTVSSALSDAGVSVQDLDAIAVTQGPGLMGSLVVGLCGARGLAAGLGIPIVGVNHMNAHIMSCFITEPRPPFPFLCLTVSGGHTQLTVIHKVNDMEVIGRTLDDAAGEAFDKVGKLLGLPYPAGPHIDRLADQGTPQFPFTKASIAEFDFSFSGLKTQVMYFLRDEMKKNPEFIEKNKADLASSVRHIIVDMLIEKVEAAVHHTGITAVAIAGGVSANVELRRRIQQMAGMQGWDVFIPPREYCTDNAAMIAMSGYYQFLEDDIADLTLTPYTRSISTIQ